MVTDLRVKLAERYPRIIALIISHSLGYATPEKATVILNDIKNNDMNYCEWISACYKGKPRDMFKEALRCRHAHIKYGSMMDDYGRALAHVKAYIKGSYDKNALASWF